MKQYEHGSKDDKIRRTKERRNLVWRMEEEAADLQKIQAKTALEIGASNDPHEQHADAVAKKVASGGDASDLIKNQPAANSSAQKKEEPGLLMAKSENGSVTATDQLQQTLNSSKGGGRQLDATTQNQMGRQMGADLSDVKIHTDANAHHMSEGINAKAFTHGQDIYFKQGNFNPASANGKELLAHELTHTVQQKEGISRKTNPTYPDWVNEAITYNQQHIKTTVFRDKLIWQMFTITGNEVQRNDAINDPGIADGFVYLVKSTQRVTMPSGKKDDIMSAYNPNHDGKLGSATYKSMISKLQELQNVKDKEALDILQEGKDEKDKKTFVAKRAFSTAELDATYYNVFTLHLNVNGAEEQKAIGFYKSEFASTIAQSYVPEAEFTSVIGIIQSLLFGSGYAEYGHFNSETKTAIDNELKKPESERKIITYTFTPVNYDKRYRDMQAPPEFKLILEPTAADLKKQKEERRLQALKDRAPEWLRKELTAKINGMNLDAAIKLVRAGKPVAAPFTYAKELIAYKQKPSGEGTPVQRLQKEDSYSKEKGNYPTVNREDPTEANEMIALVFSEIIEQKAFAVVREEKREKNEEKLRSGKLMTESGPTGYAYYSATYSKLQNDMLAEHATGTQEKYSKKIKDEIAAKQKQLEKTYTGYLDDYIAKITPGYEQRKIDVLKTGDAEVDKNIVYELQLANEHGFTLPPEVQAIEDEKQQAIQQKAAALNSQFISEMSFEQTEIEKRNTQMLQQDMMSFSKSLQQPFILPKWLLENAYNAVEARVNVNEKRDESSTFNTLNRMLYIDLEWMDCEFNIRQLLKIPYKPLKETSHVTRDKSGMGRMQLDSFLSEEERDRINKQWKEYWEGQERIANAKVEFYNYILNKEIIDQQGDNKGRPSVYAIKAWAYEWSDWVDERVKYWSNKNDKVSGLFTPITMQSIQTSTILKNYEQAQQHLWEIQTHPENDHGSFWNDFGDGLASTNLLYMIPFIGAIIEITDLWQVKAIAEKQEKGFPLDESEVILLESYAAINEIYGMVQTSGYSIGQGVAMAIPFIIEFIATLGVGAIAEEGFVKGTAWVLKKTVQNSLKAETKMLIVKGVGIAAKTVFHTIANPQQYFRKTVQNMMPTTLVMMDDGELRFFASSEDSMGFWAAFKDAGIHTLIDFWTEHLGGWLTKQGSAVLNKIFLNNPALRNNIIANWLVKRGIIKPGRLSGSFDAMGPLVRKNPLFRSVLADFGFGNIPEEYFEEFIANQLHQAVDGKPIKIDGGQELDTLIMVLLISGPMQLAGGISRTINNFSDVSGDRVRLEGNTIHNGVTEHTSYSFDRAFVESLDEISATEGINTTAAGKLIDQYLVPQQEKGSISTEEMSEQKKFLLNYHISSQVDVALTAWAFVDMAGGNFTESHALIKAAKGLPLTVTDLETLSKIESFESFVNAVQVMQNNGADANVQSYLQQRLIGPGTDAAFRQGFSTYFTHSVMQMNSQISGEDIDAELALYGEYNQLDPAQQNAFMNFRIRGEGGVSFKTRVDMIAAKGFTVANYMTELIKLNGTMSNAPTASTFETADQFVANAKAHTAELGTSAILQDTQTAALEQMQLMNDLHLEIASRMSFQLQTLADEEAEASGKKRLQRVQNRRMDKFFSAVANPSLSVEEKKEVMNRHLHRLEKMYGRHIEDSQVDFAGMHTLINSLNEENFGQRYLVDVNGNVMINGHPVPLDVLKADVEKANAEMAFNNIDVRYRLEVHEIWNKKEVKKEVVMRSISSEELNTLQETDEQENIFKEIDEEGVITIYKGDQKFRIQNGTYYEWDGTSWKKLDIGQKEFEKIVGNSINNIRKVISLEFNNNQEGNILPIEIRNGTIYSLTTNKTLFGLYNFVITIDGRLVIGQGHSFLSDKEPVLAAGNIKIRHGRIELIDNYSGHYAPSVSEMSTTLKKDFSKLGINVTGATVKLGIFEGEEVIDEIKFKIE